MNEQLENMIDEAARQRDRVDAMLAGGDDAALLTRPEPDRWSAAEQIAHLPLTERPYLAEISRSLAEARDRGWRSDGIFRGGLIGNWFARLMEPPPKRRLPTMRKLEPPPDLDRETVRADFAGCRAELIALLGDADGVDLDRAKIASPFLSLLRMPVFSGFRIVLAHGRRHIWLAERTLGGEL